MTAIILCPGPSLTLYEKQSADVTIGVNRAALAHRCDWWAASDLPMIRDYAPELAGYPNLFSREQAVLDIARVPFRLARFPQIRYYEDIRFQWSNAPKNVLTAEAALIFAAFLGAKRIAVYGAGWTGTKDFDGKETGENRSDDRWAKERENWERVLIPFVKERGVLVVNRVQ